MPTGKIVTRCAFPAPKKTAWPDSRRQFSPKSVNNAGMSRARWRSTRVTVIACGARSPPATQHAVPRPKSRAGVRRGGLRGAFRPSAKSSAKRTRSKFSTPFSRLSVSENETADDEWYERFVRPLLFCMDAEKAHHLASGAAPQIPARLRFCARSRRRPTRGRFSVELPKSRRPRRRFR